MIEYNEIFEFDNSVGHFAIRAYTEEHPSGYGNGTLLRMDIESDFPCERYMSYDARYAPISSVENVRSIAKNIIREEFGVEV